MPEKLSKESVKQKFKGKEKQAVECPQATA